MSTSTDIREELTSGTVCRVDGYPIAMQFKHFATSEVETFEIERDEETGEELFVWEDSETVTDYDWCVMVMVGDDREIVVETDTVEIIDEDEEHCTSCGSLTCTWA